MSQTSSKRSSLGFPTAQHQQKPAGKIGADFSLHADKRGGKFISHLLGLDHEQPSANGQSGAKSAALKGIKLTDALSGVKMTPNFMFFLLFFGFFLWLFVIYWVRHHEPLANQVLGTPKTNERKAALDRRLVAGIKNAFPVQTSATTGEIYVPSTTSAAPPAAAVTAAAQPYPAQYSQSPAPLIVPVEQQASFGSPESAGFAGNQGATAGGVSAIQAVPANAVSPALPVGQGNYMVGIQTNSGTRVKTIVSR